MKRASLKVIPSTWSVNKTEMTTATHREIYNNENAEVRIIPQPSLALAALNIHCYEILFENTVLQYVGTRG